MGKGLEGSYWLIPSGWSLALGKQASNNVAIQIHVQSHRLKFNKIEVVKY